MSIVRSTVWPLAGLLLTASISHAAAARTPLLAAVKNGDTAIVRALVAQPGLVNVAESDGTTALHWATDRNDIATARLLVNAGANVRAANRYGVTPIYSAAVHGNAAMLELLIKAGAD
ncbi:MAG: ankyrin repeat domain-containing protein, partial [Vicinamibacterales bacterium]